MESMDILLTGLYWLANILLVVLAVLFAIRLWNQKRRLPWSVLLVLAGVAWHIGRGVYAFNAGTCEPFLEIDGFLFRASKCIPATADDVVWAQVAILTGLFVVIAEVFRRYGQASSQ